MYLIGCFYDNGSLEEGLVRIVDKIEKEHLAQAKRESQYHVFNLLNQTFFNPDKNVWEDIKKE